MKDFIVNLDHTTRQQVSILAHTEEEAAMILRDIYLSTDLLDDFPVVSKGSKIICGDVKLAMPTLHFDVPLGYEEDDEDDYEDEFDLLDLLSDIRDEMEAALEHLDNALFDLTPDDDD